MDTLDFCSRILTPTMVNISASSSDDHLASRVRRLAWEGADLIDISVVQAPYGHLLALTADGGLHGVNLESGMITKLSRISLPTFEPEEDNYLGQRRLRLHASANGEFAAIVLDYDQPGLLVRAADGAVTLRLDGGDYLPETVPFSASFTRHAGRDVLIHRTAWNRLDVSDAATGALLTERHMAPLENGQPRPAHYLEYFHGRLAISPDGDRIFDDGWIWHPVAVPCVWSLTDWLVRNVWESEDGASRLSPAIREDWTIPTCWIDNRHLAQWVLADWNDKELEEISNNAGVSIYDLDASPEPTRRRLPIPLERADVRDLFSDGTRLFVASESGVTVWDIASGEQRGSGYPGFVARLHDRVRKTLISFGPAQIVELYLEE